MKEIDLYQADFANIVSEVFDNEVVIINLDNGNYFSYEGAGVEIWKCIQNETSIKQIVDYLALNYPSITENELFDIITDSLDDLLKESLIIKESKKIDTINNKGSKNSISQVITKDSIIAPALQKFTDMKEFLLVDPIHEVDYQKWPEKVDKS